MAETRPLAVVTGASTGIGYHLAKECAANGFDLLVAADEAVIDDAAADFRALGASVDAHVAANLLDQIERGYRENPGRGTLASFSQFSRGRGHGTATGAWFLVRPPAAACAVRVVRLTVRHPRRAPVLRETLTAMR